LLPVLLLQAFKVQRRLVRLFRLLRQLLRQQLHRLVAFRLNLSIVIGSAFRSVRSKKRKPSKLGGLFVGGIVQTNYLFITKQNRIRQFLLGAVFYCFINEFRFF
jgi:hypothetical protein